MARILIAGCGYVGTALGLRLAAHGHQVWGLQRGEEALPESIRAIRADLTNPATLAGMPGGLEHVFYTAAPDAITASRYRDTYVTGPRNLIDALVRQRQPVARMLLTSSTSVYTQADGGWVDETSLAEPPHETGQLLLEGERLLREAPFPTVALRLGGIYGPHRTRLLDAVRESRARRLPGGPWWTNRIHRDDCARALAHLMTLEDCAPLYLGVDSAPAPRNELLCWLARQLGVREPPLVPAAETAEARFQRSNKRCRNDRLRASGFALRYPSYREGYRELLGTGSPA